MRQFFVVGNPRHTSGYSVASYDKIYGDEMDFLSNSGYALHGEQYHAQHTS